MLQVEFTDDAAEAAGSSCHALYEHLQSFGYKMFVYDSDKRRLVQESRREKYPYLNMIAAKDPEFVNFELALRRAFSLKGNAWRENVKASKISIITPTLNQAAFIEQTISSVLGQGYPDLEYIIIDGGSTDGTVDLIRKHERHLAYWVSEKDAGQSNAINKGLKRATGDIIAYMNSDDYYLDGAFERVADAYRENPDVDLWHGRCRIVDQFGAKVDERIGSIERYDEILDLWDVWWKRRNFVQPEVFWTKRISKKVGAFREDLNLVMDYEYWLRIFAAGGAARFIDAELAAFRLQPNQKSTQPARTAQELLEVVQPYLFGPSERLTHQKRRALQAKWIYQAGFLNEVEQSLDRDEARWRRLMRLAWFSATNPRVMMAPGFWERVPGIRSFSNRTTAQS